MRVRRDEEQVEVVVVVGGFGLDYVGEVEVVGECPAMVGRMEEMVEEKTRAVVEVVGGQVVVCGGRTRVASYSPTCHGLDPTTGVWHR